MKVPIEKFFRNEFLTLIRSRRGTIAIAATQLCLNGGRVNKKRMELRNANAYFEETRVTFDICLTIRQSFTVKILTPHQEQALSPFLVLSLQMLVIRSAE